MSLRRGGPAPLASPHDPVTGPPASRSQSGFDPDGTYMQSYSHFSSEAVEIIRTAHKRTLEEYSNEEVGGMTRFEVHQQWMDEWALKQYSKETIVTFPKKKKAEKKKKKEKKAEAILRAKGKVRTQSKINVKTKIKTRTKAKANAKVIHTKKSYRMIPYSLSIN